MILPCKGSEDHETNHYNPMWKCRDVIVLPQL